jgi:hypothetical protein
MPLLNVSTPKKKRMLQLRLRKQKWMPLLPMLKLLLTLQLHNLCVLRLKVRLLKPLLRQ